MAQASEKNTGVPLITGCVAINNLASFKTPACVASSVVCCPAVQGSCECVHCLVHVCGKDVTAGMSSHWHSLKVPKEVTRLRLLVRWGNYWLHLGVTRSDPS